MLATESMSDECACIMSSQFSVKAGLDDLISRIQFSVPISSFFFKIRAVNPTVCVFTQSNP